MENVENMEKLLEAVRNIAYGVHVYLGNGYLEKVYENCLRHRLEKAGYGVEAQKNFRVFDEDGFEIGDYFADLVVNGCLIVELKAAKCIAPEHLAQTLNYLKATGCPLGLVINFGAYKFETRKVYPPVCDGHGEHKDSPCSTRSPRQKGSDGDSHVEHGDHEESLCSTRSPRLKESGSSHGEHGDHEETLCSSRSPRKKEFGDGHGEHVEHEDVESVAGVIPQQN